MLNLPAFPATIPYGIKSPIPRKMVGKGCRVDGGPFFLVRQITMRNWLE
jgi:hypothetical protein